MRPWASNNSRLNKLLSWTELQIISSPKQTWVTWKELKVPSCHLTQIYFTKTQKHSKTWNNKTHLKKDEKGQCYKLLHVIWRVWNTSLLIFKILPMLMKYRILLMGKTVEMLKKCWKMLKCWNVIYILVFVYLGILGHGGPWHVGKMSLQVPSSRQVNSGGPSMWRSEPLQASSSFDPIRYSRLGLITWPFGKGSSNRQVISAQKIKDGR